MRVAKRREVSDIYVPPKHRAQVFAGVESAAGRDEDLVDVHLGGGADVVGGGSGHGGDAHARDEAIVHA